MRRLEHKQRDRRGMDGETNTSRRWEEEQEVEDQRNTQINLEEEIKIINTRQRQGNSEISLQHEYSGVSTRYLVRLSADKLLATFDRSLCLHHQV